MKRRVAIIGAGPCGLSQLHAFVSLDSAEFAEIELICFEKQSSWGGQWNDAGTTSNFTYGEYSHSGMYKNLVSNGPKECLEYGDYSFVKHFGRTTPSYPPREALADYVMGRAKLGALDRFIRYNTAVRWVSLDSVASSQGVKEDRFGVVVENLTTNDTSTYTFDQVIVATGHFSCQHIPHFEGIEKFAGRVIHSHEFEDAALYAGLTLLVVGGSYSAEDISLQAMKYGARSVTISYRSKRMGFKWPEVTISPIQYIVRVKCSFGHLHSHLCVLSPPPPQ